MGLQFPERSLKVSAEAALRTIEETTGRTFALAAWPLSRPGRARVEQNAVNEEP